MINKNDFEKPRWLYRFDNFERAFLLLREVIQIIQERKLSPLEQEGVIQRFEYTWELTDSAWPTEKVVNKQIKDLIFYNGVGRLQPVSVFNNFIIY